MKQNKTHLGQVWTPAPIVKKMLKLITIKNPQLILEPASGTGCFYWALLKAQYKNVIGIEIDPRVAHQNAHIDSYFNTNYRPDVIIGNPPYVAFKAIQNRPINTKLIHKPNLYHYFLEKALSDLQPNGQIIWIIPANIFTNSSAQILNQIIYQNFSITHWELINENVWANAAIATAIVKIVKTPNHPASLKYYFSHGKIIFGSKLNCNQHVVIKVGGASGFKQQLLPGTTKFVTSQTERTKSLQAIDYQPQQWIRPVPQPPQGFTYQIFVNCKTRKTQPFYLLKTAKSQFIHYDAAVLCLYTFGSKQQTINLMNKLNRFDWTNCAIKRSGRYHFSQSILKALLN